MARVPLPAPEALSGATREVYDRIAASRGVPVENIFLALLNTPDLADGVLGLASTLRASTALPRPLRELAVVTVGLETGAEYEVNHHWNAALKAGVRREQLEALFEGAPGAVRTGLRTFDDEDLDRSKAYFERQGAEGRVHRDSVAGPNASCL